jgi:hypothetical protein
MKYMSRHVLKKRASITALKRECHLVSKLGLLLHMVSHDIEIPSYILYKEEIHGSIYVLVWSGNPPYLGASVKYIQCKLEPIYFISEDEFNIIISLIYKSNVKETKVNPRSVRNMLYYRYISPGPHLLCEVWSSPLGKSPGVADRVYYGFLTPLI